MHYKLLQGMNLWAYLDGSREEWEDSIYVIKTSSFAFKYNDEMLYGPFPESTAWYLIFHIECLYIHIIILQ